MVDVTTGAGRTTRYKVERSVSGALTRTVTSPSGAVTTLAVDSVGKRTLTLPSGERRITVPTADARFGGAVQRPLELTVLAPSGKSATSSFEYSASLPAQGAQTGPTSMTTRQTLPNGTVRTEAYDGSTRSFTTTTSPATRRIRRVLDARARLVRVELGNQALATKLDPITVAYDATGVSEVRQGSQVTRYEHDAAGRLTAIVAADGQRLEYVYDAADRLTERRYPGGRTYRYGYDADGELTSRRLPSTRTHAFTPTGFMDQISAWTPPGGAGAYTAARRRRRARHVGHDTDRRAAHGERRRRRAGDRRGLPRRRPRRVLHPGRRPGPSLRVDGGAGIGRPEPRGRTSTACA